MHRTYLLLPLALAFAACGSSSTSDSASGPGQGPGASPGNTGDGPDATATAPPPDAASSPDSAPLDAGPPYGCTDGVTEKCSAWNARAKCVPTPDGGTWVTEVCAGGCFLGKCSPSACTDECVLGAHQGGQTCKLWSMGSASFVAADPAGSLHDRARDYDRILRAFALPDGQVMNPRFTDTSLTQVLQYSGFHDAAIWTGTALAAQAWRYIATGAPDAAAELGALARTIHTDFTVSGDPGYLARMAVPMSTATLLDDPNPCADPEWHCNVSFNGSAYRWLGATSRDQYTGALLGAYAAYVATDDASVKASLRADVVAVAKELMTDRPQVPAALVIDGIPIAKDLHLQNVILAPSEMKNGKVQIAISTSNPGDAHISGMREFFPDYGVLVGQVLGFNVPIPRPSSAIMLGAIFRIALKMTEGVASMSTTHQALKAYYDAHADAWLGTGATWKFDAACGKGYFANHITFIMAYAYASLETDAPRLALIRDQILDRTMWGALGGHKNPYFAFLWASTRPSPPTAEIDTAARELAEFAPGPRVHAPRANTTNPAYMPHDATCTSQVLCDTATLAVDVKDRVVDDFLWQREPWALEDPGDPREVYPGVDYLAAYWAGRARGFLQDDRGGTCARFGP